MALLQPSSLRRASCCSTSLTGFSGWYSLRPTVVSCRRQVLCCLVRPFSARRREPFAHVKHNRAPCLSSVRLLGVMPTGSCFAYSVIRVCSPYDLPYCFTCLCRHPIFWSEGSGGPFALVIHSAHSPSWFATSHAPHGFFGYVSSSHMHELHCELSLSLIIRFLLLLPVAPHPSSARPSSNPQDVLFEAARWPGPVSSAVFDCRFVVVACDVLTCLVLGHGDSSLSRYPSLSLPSRLFLCPSSGRCFSPPLLGLVRSSPAASSSIHYRAHVVKCCCHSASGSSASPVTLTHDV